MKQLMTDVIDAVQDFSASLETKSTQILQGIVAGIEADSSIDEKEIASLQRWLYENDFLSGHYPYDKIKEKVFEITKDRIVTNDEKDSLLSLLNEIFLPIKEVNKKIIEFSDKEFCLSGDFEHGSKKDVANYIISKGGRVVDTIKKKTANYVVVGGLGSSKYSNVNYGTKVKKALEFGILVLTEKQLYEI